MGRTPAGETRSKVFAFVRDQLLAGRPPTVREVQQAFGFRAVQTARQHLEQLVDEGRLVAARHRSRGYRLPDESTGHTVLAPLLGGVPAGALDEAIQDVDPDGYLQVRTKDAASELFALRVRGESMTGVGILPGDVVIVRRQPVAKSGEIVVALVENDATVKTFKPRGRRVELRPENPAFESIVLDARAVVILGKVIEVRRTLP